MDNEKKTVPSKKLSKLREEKARNEEKLKKALEEREELEHRLTQAENRADYLNQKERRKRTHRLCMKGGVIESLLPGFEEISEHDFYELMKEIFTEPGVQFILEDWIKNDDEGEDDYV
nr:DUF3847 domain-containing protein [Clostridia bacterium]